MKDNMNEQFNNLNVQYRKLKINNIINSKKVIQNKNYLKVYENNY